MQERIPVSEILSDWIFVAQISDSLKFDHQPLQEMIELEAYLIEVNRTKDSDQEQKTKLTTNECSILQKYAVYDFQEELSEKDEADYVEYCLDEVSESIYGHIGID